MTPFTIEKIAVFAPIPSASVRIATVVKPGLRRSIRNPCRTSRVTSSNTSLIIDCYNSSRMQPLRLAFLGCGFITQVHSRHLKGFKSDIVASYASRERAKAEEYCRRFHGSGSYADYAAAIDDPQHRRRGHRRAAGLSS